MSSGTLYLTEDEYELFKVDYNDREETFYVPRSVDADDVGPIRPVITTANLIETHHILECWDWSDNIDATFDHYQDGYEKSAKLDIKIIDDEQYDAHIESIVQVLQLQDLTDEAIAALLEAKARELTHE